MRETFNGVWWSVELPSGWIGKWDEECATFLGSLHSGALQISSARKDGGPVTERDPREFAEGRIPPCTKTKRVMYGSFEGLSAEY
jgi:hypothetical protein